jgi:hypothetical protein
MKKSLNKKTRKYIYIQLNGSLDHPAKDGRRERKKRRRLREGMGEGLDGEAAFMNGPTLVSCIPAWTKSRSSLPPSLNYNGRICKGCQKLFLNLYPYFF